MMSKISEAINRKPTLFDNGEGLSRWQHWTAWPMIVLSLVYIFVYVVPIYWYPPNHTFSLTADFIAYLIWGIFVLDLLVELTLAKSKRKYLKTEWFTIIVVIFPFFRPIRAVRGVLFIRQAGPRNTSFLKRVPVLLAFLASSMVLIIGAAVLDIERNVPGATITTSSDAVWWALGEITTAGAGNLDPITNQGRLLAAVLLMTGLGIIASTTGLIAAWVVRQFNTVEEDIEKNSDVP